MSEDAKPFVDRFYTTIKAAEILDVKPATFARSLAPRAGLTPYRLNERCVRWSGAELNAMLAAAASRQKPSPCGAAAARQKQAG